VFLDRDGTINEEVEFLRSPAQLELIPGAGEAICTLNRSGIVICVISNQSGVARGFLTEADLIPIHEKLTRELERKGASIDRIYYCPHHPSEGKPPYNIICDCRKPSTGMLRRGEEEFSLDLSRSFVVGDRIVDVQVGKAVGASTVLVLTGYGRQSLEECRSENIRPDFVAKSIVQAVEFIMHEHQGARPQNG
jgi:D-glycero-D-manno-heptose 1,7-bisphosphate phosphatase